MLSAGYKTPNKKQKKGANLDATTIAGIIKSRSDRRNKRLGGREKGRPRPKCAAGPARPGPPMSRCTAGTHSTICRLKQFFIIFSTADAQRFHRSAALSAGSELDQQEVQGQVRFSYYSQQRREDYFASVATCANVCYNYKSPH